MIQHTCCHFLMMITIIRGRFMSMVIPFLKLGNFGFATCSPLGMVVSCGVYGLGLTTCLLSKVFALFLILFIHIYLPILYFHVRNKALCLPSTLVPSFSIYTVSTLSSIAHSPFVFNEDNADERVVSIVIDVYGEVNYCLTHWDIGLHFLEDILKCIYFSNWRQHWHR